MSQGRSSSFIGLPKELFVVEFKRSALRAVNSGKSFAGRRELSSSVAAASRSSCHSNSTEFQRVRAGEDYALNRRQDAIHENVKHRGQTFLNNELRKVVSIDDGKIIFDKGEIVRNGAALHISRE